MAKKYKVKQGQSVTRGEKHGEEHKGVRAADLPTPKQRTYQAGEEVELEEHEAQEMWHALEGFDEDPKAKAKREYDAAHPRDTQTPSDVPGLNRSTGSTEPGQKGLANRHDAAVVGNSEDSGSGKGHKKP